MRKFSCIYILIIFIAISNFSRAQSETQIDSLRALCRKATSDTAKLNALNQLSRYYYTFKLNKQGDSVLHEELIIAELSNNNSLILKTYFDNLPIDITSWSTSEDFNRVIQFMQEAIDFSKSINASDYMAIGYCRMSNILRQKGENDKALSNAQLALTNMENIESDSVKALVYIELGDIYKAKNQHVLASTSYSNAFDIALRSKNNTLESSIYHRLAGLYYELGDVEEAKKNLIKSVTLNKETHNDVGLLNDYTDLARYTSNPVYINLLLSLADSLHNDKYKLRAKNLMLAYYMVEVKHSKKTLEYFFSQPDLVQTFKSKGMGSYYWELGEIYRYGNEPDSALHYFNLSKNELLNNFEPAITRDFYLESAICYALKNDRQNAISNYQTALSFSRDLKDINTITMITDSLSVLYQLEGDYKNAFTYVKEANDLKNSLQKTSRDKEIALLEVGRETKKHDMQLEAEHEEHIRNRNVQYMAITIVISTVFVLMLFLGMFPISKLTIKLLGYFFFISLFEFIILMIDTFFLAGVHLEPLKLWLIKIVLIALLVPFQHLLENGLINFLASRKLLEVRNKFSIKKWFYTGEKHKEPDEVILDEDTAVL
jgi:tetratricopeptide (TPR) repeat protein